MTHYLSSINHHPKSSHKLSSINHHLSSKHGFTLLELLIVIVLLILIAIILLITLNPSGQINKGQDNKRKTELSQLNKVVEDWYNDKQCYPKPSEICYDNPVDNTCHICGDDSSSPDFNPYLARLPCDPRQPNKKYLYQTDNNTCPSWYRIYATLSNTSDPAIEAVGCSSGCGISPDYSYNYGVTSPNVGLEGTFTYCLTSNNCTNFCASVGKSCISTMAFGTYSDNSCVSTLGFCSGPTCCDQNPINGQVKSYKCYCQ